MDESRRFPRTGARPCRTHAIRARPTSFSPRRTRIRSPTHNSSTPESPASSARREAVPVPCSWASDLRTARSRARRAARNSRRFARPLDVRPVRTVGFELHLDGDGEHVIGGANITHAAVRPDVLCVHPPAAGCRHGCVWGRSGGARRTSNGLGWRSGRAVALEAWPVTVCALYSVRDLSKDPRPRRCRAAGRGSYSHYATGPGPLGSLRP